MWDFPQPPCCSPATEHDFYARFSSHPRFSGSLNGNIPAAPAYSGPGAFPLFGSASICGHGTQLRQPLRYFEDEFQHNEMRKLAKCTRHAHRPKIAFSGPNFKRSARIFDNFRSTLNAFSSAPTSTRHNRKFSIHRYIFFPLSLSRLYRLLYFLAPDAASRTIYASFYSASLCTRREGPRKKIFGPATLTTRTVHTTLAITQFFRRNENLRSK